MPRVCLLALVGLSGAGKTTFCQWLLAQPPAERLFNVVHLCYDDFLGYTEDPDAVDFKQKRSEILELLEKLSTDLKTSAAQLPQRLAFAEGQDSQDYIVVCDDNHYYRSMRYKICQICRSTGAAFGQIFFECDIVESRQRNAQRPATARIPLELIDRMAEKLEPPSPEHNGWEKVGTFTIAKNQRFPPNMDDLREFLNRRFKDTAMAPKSIEEMGQKVPQSPSQKHTLDILLRRRIKELLAEEDGAAAKRQKAAVLNGKRKQILSNFNGGEELLLSAAQDLQELVDLLTRC